MKATVTPKFERLLHGSITRKTHWRPQVCCGLLRCQRVESNYCLHSPFSIGFPPQSLLYLHISYLGGSDHHASYPCRPFLWLLLTRHLALCFHASHSCLRHVGSVLEQARNVLRTFKRMTKPNPLTPYVLIGGSYLHASCPCRPFLWLLLTRLLALCFHASHPCVRHEESGVEQARNFLRKCKRMTKTYFYVLIGGATLAIILLGVCFCICYHKSSLMAAARNLTVTRKTTAVIMEAREACPCLGVVYQIPSPFCSPKLELSE